MQIISALQKEYEEYKENNSKDSYSQGVVTFGEAWADLMEAALAAGASITDCAKSTSHTANTDGITGFMYGCAVQALAHFWIHGEALRRWHNKDTQLHDEGDKANESGAVLNPAILNIQLS